MEFQKGRPPHVGWWLCSSDWWRWWDGENWSFGAKAGCSESTLRAAYKAVALFQCQYWCDFWPENALVSRLSTNPEKPKMVVKKQNKQKTVHVVMYDKTPLAVFDTKPQCLDYVERGNIWWTSIEKIRFRTPE